MLCLSYKKHTSVFKQPAGTSRGILTTKDSWILELRDNRDPEKKGVGEVSIIENLSIDDPAAVETKLNWLSANINTPFERLAEALTAFPAIVTGLEMAMLSLNNGGGQVYYRSDFTGGKSSIPINGLVWMGSYAFMREQLQEKLKDGYRCIKLKIGAINFEEEINLLRQIRTGFPPAEMEIRLDANGAFGYPDAIKKMERLAEFDIHSIEQPVRQGQWKEMAALCAKNIIPVALDEELIGIQATVKKKQLLDNIKPQYIILKPSLLGGFKACDEWIRLAEERNIGWWATSALETNIGLNAIAQWTASKKIFLPQGLGTGQLFTNNFDGPLVVKNGRLHYLAGSS